MWLLGVILVTILIIEIIVVSYGVRSIIRRSYTRGRLSAIDEFEDRMIAMMPGHRQDISEVAAQLRGDESYAQTNR